MWLLTLWRGSGHAQWEALWTGWFLSAVDEALEKGKKTADISDIFSRDFLSINSGKYTKEQTFKHLIQTFDICSDVFEKNVRTLKVKFKI